MNIERICLDNSASVLVFSAAKPQNNGIIGWMLLQQPCKLIHEALGLLFVAVLFGCSEMSAALVGLSLHHFKENHLAD